ncbi:HNH endonuclease [Spirosoma foliorum]|nr:HNH endonuclease signature motif containing protein [Spirosoma foliorum]
MADLYPMKADKTCACGCGVALKGRQTRWASQACQDKAVELYCILQGDSNTIRVALANRDNGVCARCGNKPPGNQWEADHIVPVHKGGGYCDLDNFQTLCIPCHRDKTLLEQYN